MTQYAFVFDNFNDNSIDSRLWVPQAGSTKQAETGGRMTTLVAASTAPTVMFSRGNYFDLSKGRLAIRLSKSGTTDANIYTYLGIRDINGFGYSVYGRSTDGTLQQAVNDLGVGAATNTETTQGLGPSLAANAYVGWSYNAGTKTYDLSRSTDGVTWTQMYKYVVTTSGSFNWHQVGLMIGCISFGTVTTYTPSWDDMTYFVQDTALKVKVRSGGAWVDASVKTRVGGAWKRPITKVRSSALWGRPNP